MTLKDYLDAYYEALPSYCFTYAEEDWPLKES